MPNPKVGTVTPNVAQAVKDAKSGSVEFRVEKAGIIHAGIGKSSFSEGDIETNVKAFLDALTKARPSGAKARRSDAPGFFVWDTNSPHGRIPGACLHQGQSRSGAPRHR